MGRDFGQYRILGQTDAQPSQARVRGDRGNPAKVKRLHTIAHLSVLLWHCKKVVVSHRFDHLGRRNPATWQDNAAVAIEPHKLGVDGSNPSPATNERPQQQITIADKAALTS